MGQVVPSELTSRKTNDYNEQEKREKQQSLLAVDMDNSPTGQARKAQYAGKSLLGVDLKESVLNLKR